MKNKEYTRLKEYYEKHNQPSGTELRKKCHKNFREDVRRAVPFLDNAKGEKRFGLYLWCVLNDIEDYPSCPVCGEPIKSVRKTKFNDYF